MREKITLYFVRHGETDWNAERRYQGQVDIPLNESGRAQARRNGGVLRDLLASPETLDFVASPLCRARETMELIRASLGLPEAGYRLDERLKELSYGSWEGKLQVDLPQIDPDGLARRGRDPFRWRPIGGESYADLLVRSCDWLASIERDTLAVAHGGVSRCLRAYVLGLDPSSIPDLESPQDRVLILTKGQMQWL